MARVVAIVLLLACCGCTHIQLQRKTINQGSTLSGIQYQQVLDNLAMFACNPDALAWHVKVTGGVVQVADQGNLALLPAQVGRSQVVPSVAAGRNVLEQWNVDAVIEPDDLELLQLAYQKAIDPADATRQIKRQAFQKISELSATYHIVLSESVADELLETMRGGAPREQSAKLDTAQARLKHLYARMEALTLGRDPRAETCGTAAELAEIAALKRELVLLTGSIGDQPFIPGYTLDRPQRSAVLIEQAESKIKSLFDLVTDRCEQPNPFATSWICHGCKRDIPRCACQVGHYRGCEGDCYVWVLPEHAKTLRDFTLVVLSLVPPDAQDVSLPRLGVGAAFAPTAM